MASSSDVTPTKSQAPPSSNQFCIEPTEWRMVYNETKQPESLRRIRGADSKMIILMVGLPARGKTYMSRKLAHYLSWLGYQAAVFNLGDYRRRVVGDFTQDSQFHDPHSELGWEQNMQCANLAFDDMFHFLQHEGQIGIYDGTMITHKAREFVKQSIQNRHIDNACVDMLWIESICDKPEIIEKNIRETTATSPHFTNISPENAYLIIKDRLDKYTPFYEPIDDDDLSYIKIINVSEQVYANRIQTYLPSRVCFFLMNLELNRSTIFLTRHGQSQFNLEGKVGGDTSLTDDGCRYAKCLAQYLKQQSELSDGQFSLWCSTLRRTVETAAPACKEMPAVIATQWRALCEIEVGVCDGMMYEEIDAKYPEEFAARQKDKLRYRYPRGESYLDVIQRLEVGHRAVLRCILGYFLNVPHEEVPHIDVPLHTVIKLNQKAYKCHSTRVKIGIEATDPTNTDQKLT